MKKAWNDYKQILDGIQKNTENNFGLDKKCLFHLPDKR